MKILIGTSNSSKIEGVREAFSCYFDDVVVDSYQAPSLVSDEPIDEDIYKGAKNRITSLMKYAKDNNLKYDYYTSSESGIINANGKYFIVNLAVIISHDGYESIGSSASFPVPNKYVREIITSDLGKVTKKIFNEEKEKYDGTIDILTKGRITRTSLIKEAFMMALVPYINHKWKDNK